MTENTVNTDVLVVGGGGGGVRAAIGAREKGADVMLLSKGPLGRCGATPMAGADFNLDGRSLIELGLNGAPNDSKEKVFNDIVTQGYYLNNQKLVEQYVQDAPDRLKELLDWGIKISRSEERSVITSGLGIMDTLLKKARDGGVNLLDDTMLIDLITRDGKITGALGLDIMSGEFIHFVTKAVIIATGGWHHAFQPNTGMRDLTGDGIAMAHRAGADIGNMEFITFCPNIFYTPPIWRGSIAPYIVQLICGGSLTNNQGEDILNGYDPDILKAGAQTEWNKNFLSFVEAKEEREGRGFSNGGIHYSRGNVPWKKMEAICSRIFKNWKYKALDLSEWGRMLKDNEPVEIGPAVEYFDGGIVVNERFETCINGLYAAGECTLGPFGANRVFAAITEMLVHGAAAGENAGDYAKIAKVPQPDRKSFEVFRENAELPLTRKAGIKPNQVRRPLQEMAHKKLGPIRDKDGLQEIISLLETIKKDRLPYLGTTSKSKTYNKEWIDTIELRNIVHLLEVSAKSALARTESRGVHYREDYPHTDNENWLLESVVKLVDSDVKIHRRPPVIDTLTPPKGVIPYLEMMKSMMAAHSDVEGGH